MPGTEPGVSVVICTYNRAELLDECLQSLTRQSADPASFEVIVVDNNSTDATAETCQPFLDANPNYRYVRENHQGLSHARNRGYREARTAWVCYLDDDARAFENYVERILHVTKHYDFDCFGGIFLPWYKYGKPRWYRDEYGSKTRERDDTGPLETGFVFGGVMVVRKQVLETLGGFPADIGMSGESVSYGEEIHLQTRMRRHGMSIGFDPELKIHHLVNRYKLKPGWFLVSAYANGRDDWQTFDREATWPEIAKIPMRAIIQLLVACIRFSPRLLKSDYYIQNWIIDTVSPFSRNLGKLQSGLRYKIRSPGKTPNPG